METRHRFCTVKNQKGDCMSIINILIVLVLLSFLGVLPNWGYSHSWGYGPSGLLGLLLVIFLVMAVSGRIRA